MVLQYIVYFIVDYFVVLVPLLVGIAIFTLFERKVLGLIQRRRGPNVVGLFGILQPFADGIKLLLKETVIPIWSDRVVFIAAPIFTFSISLVSWSALPFGCGLSYVNIQNNVLLILGLSSLGIYGFVLSGWSSNSKYAFYGALRAAAQILSYEISMGLALIPVLLLANSVNIIKVIEAQYFCWNLLILLPSALLFLICSFAETNRTPFDLPEAEGELVAGYNVEYSSISFALFFLAEYSNIMLVATLFNIFYTGGWSSGICVTNFIFFSLKTCLLIYMFVWVRAILPRYRFDQLIQLGWQVLLPLSLGYFMLVSGNCIGVTKLC